MRNEYKFALPTSLGLLLGVVTGPLLFFVLVGTVFGLVWGYSDHLLHGSHSHSHAKPRASKAKKATRKTTKRKAAKRRSSKR